MNTQMFARLEPPGLNPFESERRLIDGNGKQVGVAVPSSAFPGSLVICLDVKLIEKLRS